MSADLKAKLIQLKELHELGLLTDADFQKQKDGLMEAAMGTTPASPPSSLAGATRVDASASPGSETVDPLAGATRVDAPAGLPSRLGNYKVLGIIGAGGMGTVVRARHDNAGWARRQGGDVALKLIHPHIAADPSFQERFLDEAELGRRVQHPGLARVYDVVSEGPWLGTVLEYIDGRELSEWIRPGGLPLDEVVALLTPLAEALDHLHSQGIVHRDLKPANVRVRPDGRPVLLDLGIAKDLSGDSGGQTQTMTTMGTSAWMAPEQADAKSVTAEADVYAFGLVAYALLAGRMPWGDGESELRVLANKLVGKLAPLSSAAPQVPKGVSDVVMGALALAPHSRPAGCAELMASLTRPPRLSSSPDALTPPVSTERARPTPVPSPASLPEPPPAEPNRPTEQRATQATIRVIFEGIWMLGSGDIRLQVDDAEPQLVGNIVQGVHHEMALPLGEYRFTFEIGLRRRAYSVDVSSPGVYELEITYSRMWGNFNKQCRFQAMDERTG